MWMLSEELLSAAIGCSGRRKMRLCHNQACRPKKQLGDLIAAHVIV